MNKMLNINEMKKRNLSKTNNKKIMNVNKISKIMK